MSALTAVGRTVGFNTAFGKTGSSGGNSPVVAVVDSFEGGVHCHGNQVSALLRQQLPGVDIIPFAVERKPGYLAIGEALARVAEAVRGGLKLHGLNLSMGTMRPLSDVMGGKPSPNTLPMSQLLDQAAHHPNDPTSEYEQEPLSAVAGGLRALQQLVERGV